jgi:glycosyltransferase involved in cell wall biosynthesis
VKRVLVITYYWPPSGGAGVQRWLKLTKYLPGFGWQPVVYTPENPESPVDDPSLMKDVHPEAEVIRRRILEPYTLYKRFMGLRGDTRINAGFLAEEEKSGKKEGLSIWIRGNLFIPDARRFWIGPSFRYLKSYLRKHPVDAVISTGPPHSMHMIGMKLARHTRLPWIADFRDPWTEIDFYHHLKLSSRADRRHRALEQKVLREASLVIVVGKTMGERFAERAGIRTLVIPNGYDDSDFGEEPGTPERSAPEMPPPERSAQEKSGVFSIVHIGAMNPDRNHPVFWQAVSSLLSREKGKHPEIRVKLIGKVDISVHRDIQQYGLEDVVELLPSLPHEEIMAYLKTASVLYLPINRTPTAKMIATGKIFEYLAAGRPILGIGPVDGDAADIIRDCNAGVMIGFDDRKGVEEQLAEWAGDHMEGKLEARVTGADRYSRRKQTALLAGALEDICEISGSRQR